VVLTVMDCIERSRSRVWKSETGTRIAKMLG
jgi:hypothetical protein